MSALRATATTSTSANHTPRENLQEIAKKYYANKRSQPAFIQTHIALKGSSNQQNYISTTAKNSTIDHDRPETEHPKLPINSTLKTITEDHNGRLLPRLNNLRNDEKTPDANLRARYKEDMASVERTPQGDQPSGIYQERYLSFLENLKKNMRDKKTDAEIREKRRIEELNKIRNEMGILNVKSRVYDFARRATHKLDPITPTQESEIISRGAYNRNSLANGTIDEEQNMTSNLLAAKMNTTNRILRELSPQEGTRWIRESRSIQKELTSTYTPGNMASPNRENARKLRNTLSVDAFKELKKMPINLEGQGNPGDESRVFERKREDKTLATVLKNETDITRWKKLQNISLDTKVFIIIGGYEALRKALVERGWIENPNKRSACYDLKWTTNECDVWSDLLLDAQLINHYPGNECIVTKAGLCRTLRNVVKNVDPSSFYPRCYEIGNQTHLKAFIEDFKLTKVESILKRLLSKQTKLDARFKSQVETALKVGKRHIKCLESGAEFKMSEQEWAVLSADELSKEELASKKHNTWLKQQGGSKGLAENPENQKNEAEKTKQQKKKSSAKKGKSKGNGEGKDSDDEDMSKMVQQWEQTAKSIVDELGSRSAQSSLNGVDNIWIVKPSRLSRGRGIVCYKNLVEILDRTRQGGLWVVQKYIENPLIIHKRKFDIRQWVLVTDWNPLTVWFYEECYLRFGALEYDTSNIENRYIHLTNNSVTKYCKVEEEIEGNMWSSTEFEEYLKKENPRDDNVFQNRIKPSMKKIVYSSLLSAQKYMEPNKNAFELYGYDFMVDDDYNAWLIEVNCSPAMDYSTKITERLVKMVLEDTAKVLVDSNMGKKSADTGLWTKLGKNIVK